MRIQALLICAFLLCFLGLKAQEGSPFTIESNFWKQGYYKDSVAYKLSELIVEFEGSGPADGLIRKANNQHDFARFCKLSGAFLILYPFINQAVGRDPNYVISFIGAGLIGISVPLELGSRHQATQAVLVYNERQKAKLKAQLHLSPMGLGLRLRF